VNARTIPIVFPDEAPAAKARLRATPLRGDRGRLSDRLAAEIERQIVSGDLEAGALVPTEPELGELFGVSRTVVRDAVRTLAARGLLDVRAGRGTTILPPSDDALSRALLALLARSELSMGEVMDARAALEIELIPLAATQATDEQRDAVAACLARFERAVAEEDWPRAHEADLGFHLALLRATGLPALAVMLRPLQQVIMICSRPAQPGWRASWQVERHRAVCAALLAHDADALGEALREHFAYAEEPAYRRLRARPFGRVPAVRDALATRQ
jgi:GntR family transcriptional regulator, transcriptional repressor for pyruvate dehydrogenase complex